jgi:hypothetical protein
MKVTSFIGCVFFIGGIVYCWVSYASFTSYLACFDEENKNFEEIRMQSQIQGWDDQRNCSLSYEEVQTTSICIENSQQKDTSFSSGFHLLSILYPFIRPQAKSAGTWIIDHNAKCAQFPSFQFEE